jgi:hypothetical protein
MALEAVAGIQSRAAPPGGPFDESVTLFHIAGSHSRTLSEQRRARSQDVRGSVD